jgi:uncharacterized protein YoxC
MTAVSVVALLLLAVALVIFAVVVCAAVTTWWCDVRSTAKWRAAVKGTRSWL